MIQKGTLLWIIDNSGIKKGNCIWISKGFKKRYSFLGDIILVSIRVIRWKKKKRRKSRVKKGDVVKALIIKTWGLTNFMKNNIHKFYDNCAVLFSVKKKKKFYGSRVFGAVSRFFWYTRYLKVLVLSSGVCK